MGMGGAFMANAPVLSPNAQAMQWLMSANFANGGPGVPNAPFMGVPEGGSDVAERHQQQQERQERQQQERQQQQQQQQQQQDKEPRRVSRPASVVGGDVAAAGAVGDEAGDDDGGCVVGPNQRLVDMSNQDDGFK